MASSFGLLDPADEDSLHATRLLNIEEKLFKRINKRLLAKDSLIAATEQQKQQATPPPQGYDETEAEARKLEEERTRTQWRDEAVLDFAAFEGNIVRAQFLLRSNEQERQRYADEKTKIMQTAAAIRENNLLLQEQLTEARQILEIRKSYDKLAEKILSNEKLLPREEQQAIIDKLDSEIATREEQSAEYAKTWAERREQFGRIVDECMQLRSLIRAEKEEAERKQGMEEDSGDGDGTQDAADEQSAKVDNSAVGTPRNVDDGSVTALQNKDQLPDGTNKGFTNNTDPPAGHSNSAQDHEMAVDGHGGEREEGEEAEDSTAQHISDDDEIEEGEADEDSDGGDEQPDQMDTS